MKALITELNIIRRVWLSLQTFKETRYANIPENPGFAESLSEMEDSEKFDIVSLNSFEYTAEKNKIEGDPIKNEWVQFKQQ